jgi:hypothetical protein
VPEKSRLKLGLPQLVGLLAVVLFVPWLIMTGSAERQTRRAIENYQPFAAPEFPFSFSKTIKFDALGFLGTGMNAGLWEWTPQGMKLTDKGRTWFSDTPEKISATMIAGRRVISAFNGYSDHLDGTREARFHWRWTEISGPAETFLSRQPKSGEEYEGRAILARQNGQWVVQKLETPDFDIPMAQLRDNGAGVAR